VQTHRDLAIWVSVMTKHTSVKARCQYLTL
jgi:hypothetical protein